MGGELDEEGMCKISQSMDAVQVLVRDHYVGHAPTRTSVD
jgi:hypothetical protein